jgi:hypothetical protein
MLQPIAWSSAAELADDSNDGFAAGGNRRIADAAIFFKHSSLFLQGANPGVALRGRIAGEVLLREIGKQFCRAFLGPVFLRHIFTFRSFRGHVKHRGAAKWADRDLA